MAQSLYIKYCKVFNPEAVRNLYDMEDDYASQAELYLQESYSEKVNLTF